MTKGTFQFCKTNEAIRRLESGDILENVREESFWKKVDGVLFVSHDRINWHKTEQSLSNYPVFEDWHSLSNLHYYEDIKNQPGKKVFLTKDHKKLTYDQAKDYKDHKRWYIEREA